MLGASPSNLERWPCSNSAIASFGVMGATGVWRQRERRMEVFINRSLARAVTAVLGPVLRPAVSTAAVVAAVTLVAAGCNSGSPTQPEPQPQPPAEVSGTITFANAGPATSITTHSESGFVVQFRSGNWEVLTNYGNPMPAPIFSAPSGTTVTGEVQITAAGGAEFAFRSVDVYSSLTPIPYVIVGTRRGTKEVDFSATLPGVVGNTFGDFRTVVTPSAGRLLDTLTVTLTNTMPPIGGSNPMGLDNIVLGR